MRLQEHQAKALFAEAGIPVPDSLLAESVEEAVAAATELGLPVAVKAQVRVGGRGKAGGVELAKDRTAVRAAAERILGMTIDGHLVESVLIEAAVDAETELYVGITIDREAGQPVAMVSREGGVDIETVADERPAAIAREPIDPAFGVHGYQARRAAYEAGLDREIVGEVASVVTALYELWDDRDGREAEINPLMITDPGGDGGGTDDGSADEDSRVVAADAVFSLDDAAAYRQPALAAQAAEPADEFEARAAEHGFDYVRLEGTVGVIGNGAGLVMATLDLIDQLGGAPANFLDIGGGADADRVAAAMELVYDDQSVEAVLFNVFGGITRCDEVARGINDALATLDGPPKPTVVRLAGTNAAAGRDVLDPALRVERSFEAAVEAAIAAARDTPDVETDGDATDGEVSDR